MIQSKYEIVGSLIRHNEKPRFLAKVISKEDIEVTEWIDKPNPQDASKVEEGLAYFDSDDEYDELTQKEQILPLLIQSILKLQTD